MTGAGDVFRRAVIAATRPHLADSPFRRGAYLAIVGYQILGLAALIVGLLSGLSWLGQPFPGILLSQALVVTRAAPTGNAQAWSLYSQGVKGGDQLQSVAGVQVRDPADLRKALTGFAPGDTVEVTLRSGSASNQTVLASLTSFPNADRTAYMILPAIVGLVSLAVGAWVFAARGRDPAGGALALVCCSLSMVGSSFFDSLTAHSLTVVWMAASAMLGASLLDFALCFPAGLVKAAWGRLMGGLAYAVALALLLYVGSTQATGISAPQTSSAFQPLYAWVVFGASVFVLLMTYGVLQRRSPVARAEAAVVSTAAVVSAGPLAAWSLLAPPQVPTFSPLLLLPLTIFPAIAGHLLLRGRVIPLGGWVGTGLVYACASVLLATAYALVVAGLSLIFRTSVPADSPWWIGGLVLSLAIAMLPAQRLLQRFIDRTFMRGRDGKTLAMQALKHDLDAATDLRSIAQILRRFLEGTLAPHPLHVFVLDGFSSQFIALGDEGGHPTTDVRFTPDGALGSFLGAQPLPLSLDQDSYPDELRPDLARIRVLGAEWILRLQGTQRLLGWLAIGARSSGKPYSAADLAALQEVAEAASYPVERLWFLDDLRRRSREVEAVTRLSQGANVTLDFDNVLELIYSQSAQMIPLSELQITRFDRNRSHFSVDFAVQDGRRLDPGQAGALAADLGLEPEVIRSGRSLLTQDYIQECRVRGLKPAQDGLRGWIGVPMNAAGETIGALSVASRDRAVHYTPGHLRLLQAIADQAAGAILQSHLLQEAEEHAQQLARLNEVARQIASTLELEPLLDTIAAGSISVLLCRAAVIYLPDPTTSELVARATSRSGATAPQGRLSEAGASLARRVYATGQPIVENTAGTDQAESSAGVANGNFWRQAMAAPLQVQDRTIGILQVMDREDGLPFVERDTALLAALAGQAAVAIENARLYTLTDQELATRVEELSTMQRIDRELNTTLESDRAMRITLEWALRHSAAEAGLIGIVENTEFRVVADSGYGGALGSNSILLSSLPAVQSAVESGAAQQRDFRQTKASGLLPGSDHQTVVPIRREASVIGVLVLEGAGGPREDLLFLGRLCDHAAVAISNAQLYDEVSRANASKSEFVSLVAHELRNPMTAIKGYAELLAAGTVGPITEMQGNFLNTIRANTDRMSTLISDLNDSSQIEAGQLRLEFRPIELAPIIAETLSSSRRQIDEKSQSVEMELPADLPMVWCDAVRVGQVLINLISNANKYTPEGGRITIGAAASDNRWDVAGPSQVVHVWVRDTGIGIRPQDEPRIFGKFFRSDDPNARGISGVGLGLNITRSLVEMQGGHVWFDTAFGQGTTFHFTVPVAQD